MPDLPAGRIELEIWVRAVSARLGKRLADAQVEMYADEMEEWGLTNAELVALERITRKRAEGQFPHLPMLRNFARLAAPRPARTQVYETFRDEEGRVVARPTGRYELDHPDKETVAMWEAEKATPEEAQAIWKAEFARFGADPEAAVARAMDGSPIEVEKKLLTGTTGLEDTPRHEPRSDFDDSPEALRESGIEVEFRDASDEPSEPSDESSDTPNGPERSDFDEL